MSSLGTAGAKASARRLLKANAWFVFAFLYVPIVVLVVFSFNDSERVNVWQGLSPRWYGEALGNTQIISALRVSLIVAISSTIVSTVLGTAVALALDRYRFKGRRALDGTVYLPIVIPDITMAVMLLVFFAEAFKLIDTFGPRLTLGVTTVALSHIAFNISFVAVVVRARLDQFDRTLEEAARDLYATPWGTFRRVTLPLIAPGIAAGALLALALSLDDVVISAFTAGPGATTLPVYVFSTIRQGVTPELNAISTLMLAASITLVVASLALQRPRSTTP
ncbi:MAG: ABC transporter permease [Acidimicrobiales bacterium]|nr:ABC transporter permease [Acidimicrobiaceae bacterium]MXV86193.1 ABC transporter permease [Acidimicrobiales bacterium]MDE0676001.1 ABC transporter permease [Acidimicrobiaceae bacterium]MXX42323.1 ABC transporter permease [Acidimicrobiales bacterium]MYA26374.1 ABC transporter permease [Acidimicrobiales bacterium]